MKFQKPTPMGLFVAGIALLLLLIFISLFQTEIIADILKNPSVSYQSGSLNVIKRLPSGTQRNDEYEIREEQQSVLNVRYPTVMRENETATVSVSVDAFHDKVVCDRVTGKERRRERLKNKFEIDENGSLTLSSSGFDLAPQMTITKRKGTPLPTEYWWTITPESDGRHMLILDFSDFNPLAQQQDRKIKLAINNLPYKESSNNMVKLEVFVNTIWGVSRVIFETIRSCIALIAFLLMYPMVTEWLGARKS